MKGKLQRVNDVWSIKYLDTDQFGHKWLYTELSPSQLLPSGNFIYFIKDGMIVCEPLCEDAVVEFEVVDFGFDERRMEIYQYAEVTKTKP